MGLYSKLFLRTKTSPYGDFTRNSVLSFDDLDQNFLFLKERDIQSFSISGTVLNYNTTGGDIYPIDLNGIVDSAADVVWKTGSTGNYSIKTINDSTTDATGDYAVAEGRNTLASGQSSHAEGFNTTASGGVSHAEGNSTTASGTYSHAEGDQALASGLNSHAEGRSTIASGDNSHAEGTNSTATGSASHAEGFYTTASGDFSHAEGGSTNASGDLSHAENENTTASGRNTHAGGRNVTASGDTSFVHYKNNTFGSGLGAYGDYSVILGGTDHNILGNSGLDGISSSIIGGSGNIVDRGSYSSIVGGTDHNIVANSDYSSIVGGTGNTIASSINGHILGGYNNSVSKNSDLSVVIAGSGNTIGNASRYNTIINGFNNTINASSHIYSFILGGQNNEVGSLQSIGSGIIGGDNNLIQGSDNSTLIGGYTNKFLAYSDNSSIIGGTGNTVDNSDYSSIMGGLGVTVQDSNNSHIIGLSQGNQIPYIRDSYNSAIIAGEDHQIDYSYNSVIIGGQDSDLKPGGGNELIHDSSIIGGRDNVLFIAGERSSILGGGGNTITGEYRTNFFSAITTNNNTIIGGTGNTLEGTLDCGIFGGKVNTIDRQERSLIIGGSGNTLNGYPSNNPPTVYNGSDNVILGGVGNEILNGVNRSAIIAGTNNYIETENGTINGVIAGGKDNRIAIIADSDGVFIGGGINNDILGYDGNPNTSAIIGGSGNTIDDFSNSVIIGGKNITATTNDTVYVPYLNISNIGTGTSISNLGIDTSGNVVSGTTSLWSSNVNGIHYNSGNVGIGMSASSVNTKLEINYSGSVENGFRIKNIEDNSQFNLSTNLASGKNLFRINSDNSGLTPLVVSNDNRVGIGSGLQTITPQATLHVYSTSNGQPIVLVEDESNPDTTPFIIDNDGNVGISTGTPTEKLDVSGNTKISGTLNIGTLGTGTSVNNLGIDGNGNVVSGDTGGSTGPDSITFEIFNTSPASPDPYTIYDDGNIRLLFDDAATDDIEIVVLTNPSTGPVHVVWSEPTAGTSGSANVTTASGQIPLNTEVSADDVVDFVIWAPEDSTYPYYEAKVTVSNGTFTSIPAVARVSKWNTPS